MRPEDALQVSRLPVKAREYLDEYFDLTVPPGVPNLTLHITGPGLVEVLTIRGLGQADVVLALLRGPASMHRHVEALVGRPVERLPPITLRPLPPLASCPHETPAADRRRIAKIDRSDLPPLRPSSRLREFRVGRTVAQLLARGVTRHEVRDAVRSGWCVLSEAGS
jgi:hypothetical protein